MKFFSASASGVNLIRGLGVVNPVAEIFDSIRKKSIFVKTFRFSTQKF